MSNYQKKAWGVQPSAPDELFCPIKPYGGAQVRTAFGFMSRCHIFNHLSHKFRTIDLYCISTYREEGCHFTSSPLVEVAATIQVKIEWIGGRIHGL